MYEPFHFGFDLNCTWSRLNVSAWKSELVMHSGQLVFTQLMAHLSLTIFRRRVNRYIGNHKAKTFSCRTNPWFWLCPVDLSGKSSRYSSQPSCAFEQALPYGHPGRCGSQHVGERHRRARLTHLCAAFAHRLITTARRLYVDEDVGLDIKGAVYALDATIIDLCLSLFPWAPLRQAKAAVKLHALLDLRGNIPTFIHITDGTVHAVNVLDLLILEEIGRAHV